MSNSLLYPINNRARRAVSLNGNWKFKLDEKGVSDAQNWANGLSDYTQIPVPSSFNDFFTDKKIREFCGDFWYETDVFVPQEWEGKDIEVRFGSATHIATVYLNGTQITHHEGGFTPFNADITKCAKYGEMNRLSVKLNNELSEDRLPAGGTITLADGRKLAKPNFDFFNYAGLQRNIWLTARPVHAIDDYETTYEINGTDATVGICVDTPEGAKITVSLLDADGVVVGTMDGAKGSITVKNAHLWEVRNAYLYTICIESEVDGEQDIYTDRIGIRTVEIKDSKIMINGRPVYLKGFGKHEDSDIAGRGFNPVYNRRDFELMKWIGANSFRTSHYPYAEEVYQMADEEGILIVDETTCVGCFPGLMNLGANKEQTPFFARATAPALLKHHLQVVDELIKRDKNHPCVIAWSLLNEPETSDVSAKAYFEKVFKEAHDKDPQKRPRTFAMIINSTPEVDQCHEYADFISLNRYYGWYVMGGPEIVNAQEAFRKELAAWEKLEPNKPILFTEYGADTNGELDKLPSVMWSQTYQIECLEMCHKVFDEFKNVCGEQIWNFADFQTTEGIIRMNGNKKGIFTRQREPKRAAFYLKERWEKHNKYEG